MKIELLELTGIGIAMHGMRLSYGSSSDTPLFHFIHNEIGDQDRALSKRLTKEGTSASKFLRFIIAYLDITAPRYWWQQFDTYRFGVEKLSTSTMHTILRRKLTQENFQDNIPDDILNILNDYIEKKEFKKVKNILPESFLQKRYVMASYQALMHMYLDRKNHKLEEWHIFCNFLIKKMPYPFLLT